MAGSTSAPRCWGKALCLLLCCCLLGSAGAQEEVSRPARRGVPSPAAPGSVATAPVKAPLAPNARISLDATGLSVDVQEQDLSAVIERIANLARIELRHPEGIPNRRVSIRFSSMPVVSGLKRLLRVAEVPGYLLQTAKRGDRMHVERLIFLPDDGTTGTGGGRGAQRSPQVAAAQPPQQARPAAPPAAAPVPPQPPAARQEESRADDGRTSGNVFDDIKSNAAARRLLSQMMHPNEQVRERAFEGLVRLVREDDKQRALMELLEPLMEDMGSEDKATQDEAREEIRKLLSR